MRRLMIPVLLVAIANSASAATPDKPATPLKVCVLSGCDTYDSESSLPPFEKYLEQHYNIVCTRVVKQAVDDLPGLEKLDDCDVALVFIKRMKLKGEQLKRFQRHMTSGRPIVGVRTASHAVQTWLEFDHEVLGGNYQSHYPVGPVTSIEVAPGAERHPILAGVSLKAAADALYKNSGHAPDIDVLLSGTIEGQPTEPLAWTRQHHGGRVFYTSLGAQDTFRNPDFRRLLANALFWTTGRSAEVKQP